MSNLNLRLMLICNRNYNKELIKVFLKVKKILPFFNIDRCKIFEQNYSYT